MSNPFAPVPPNIRPPGNLSNLQSRITAYARESGLSVSRLSQRILTEVMFGLLERARTLGVIEMYLAKGGMALELRFGIRARASGDLDIGITSGGEDLLTVFDRALRVGFDDFSFERRDSPEILENADTFRLKVKVAYRGRPFGTLSVDLNEADHETATTIHSTGVLVALGLPGPLDVPLLDPYIQLAHKLHGATEPDRADYTNRRHRDLLDVLVMTTDASLSLNLIYLRYVAIAEFARRRHHTRWPPIFALPFAWRTELARDAKEILLESSDPDELARRFIRFIVAIEGIAVKQTLEYRFHAIQLNLTGAEPLTAQANEELESYARDGWRVLHIGPRPGMVDQYLAVLERPVGDAPTA